MDPINPEQAAADPQGSAGDVLAGQETPGHASTPLVPKDDAAQAQPKGTPETKDQKPEKKGKISQEEWQKRAEKIDKYEQVFTAMAQALGLKTDDVSEVKPEDMVTTLTRQVTELKEESVRKDFESEFPVVKTEKYNAAWLKACKEKLDPQSKFHRLDYTDIWKLIRDDKEYQSGKRAVQEVERQEATVSMSSVPLTGSPAVQSDKLSAEDREIARRMGWTEKDYQAAGVI